MSTFSLRVALFAAIVAAVAEQHQIAYRHYDLSQAVAAALI